MSRRRALTRAAAATFLMAGWLAVLTPSSTAGPAAAPAGCTYPERTVPETWQPVPGPAGTLVSLGQRDRDACVLLAVTGDGAAWRSEDAGRRWTPGPGPLNRIHTEAMELPRGTTFAGPVVATRPGAGGVPDVLLSTDDGRSYQPATLTTPTGAQPLRATVHDAASGAHYGGDGKPYVYLAADARTDLLPGVELPVGPSLTEIVPALYRSTDGGRTYELPDGAARYAPTVVAVNPVAIDEVWINDTRGGGVWRSYDAGETFAQVCCAAGVMVADITMTVLPDGRVGVHLGTDAGLKSSADGGATWTDVPGATGFAVSGVRTAPDSADTVLVQVDSAVLLRSTQAGRFEPVPGLPEGCRPAGLRRTSTVPATFLVDCAGRAYRLTLRTYRPATLGTGPGVDLCPPPAGCPAHVSPLEQPLRELATWTLPNARGSGAIAFDGVHLLYDRIERGVIGVVRAADGMPQPPVVLAGPEAPASVFGITFDLRRNQILAMDKQMRVFVHDVRSGRLTPGARVEPGYRMPSYDSATDGLSVVPELRKELYRIPRTGGVAEQVCDLAGFKGGAASGTSPVGTMLVSAYVAAGDGGGYIQDENDKTLYRMDGACRILGSYSHRIFSESAAENDAMACDTQTFFPQPAIWIRDSQLGSATAYGVPVGYCPMPSHLTLTAPPVLEQGDEAPLCLHLVNATTRVDAAARPLTVLVDGRVLGRGRTDEAGRLCLPYVAPSGPDLRRTVAVTAAFAGDSALYPATAADSIDVVKDPPLPPVPPPVLRVVAPVVVVPPVPPLPPAPLPAPGPVQAPAPGTAPNLGQAPAGQPQPIAQGVVVPQRQEQPQVALVRAAAHVNAELESNGINPMTALPRRRGVPAHVTGLGLVAGVATICALGRLYGAPGLARARDDRGGRSR